MLKFVVVLYKKPGMSVEDFRQHLRQQHGPLAQKLPGSRKYVQNYVIADPKRKPPGWNGIVELISTIGPRWRRHGQVQKARLRMRTCPLLLIYPAPRGRLSKRPRF